MDWSDFTTRHWNRAPARFRPDTSLDAASAYEAVVTAAEPFRAGVRAGALPDVRLHVADGLLRAPGDLLPGRSDPALADYAGRIGERQFVLTVEQPLLLDFALWAKVRAFVAPLWRLVGTPTVPVVSELIFGRGQGGGTGADGTFIWVLSGDLRLDADGDVLVGAPGDVLYVPPGRRHDLHYGHDCLVLRLRISGDSRQVVAAVKELAAAWLQRRRGPSSVPWLPYPPRRDGGALPVIDLLAETGDAVATFSDSPEQARLLRTTWAKRVSAGALEPAPRPRQPIDLQFGQRVQANHSIVRMPDDDGWICAVNGYAFLARRTAADVLAHLRVGEPTTVDVLCAGHSRDAVLALLQRLYTLRGVDVITEN